MTYKINKHPDIFIVSSGRAGSTLFQAILNSSKQVHIPPESDFIARAYPFYSNNTSLSLEDYKVLSRLFRNTSEDTGWGMSEEYLCHYLESNKPQTLQDVFNLICDAYHEKNGTQDMIWGIKRPVLIASLGRITDLYPDAKIIHIYRDGRDVYLSYKAVHQKSPVKFGPKGVIANALYWVDGLQRITDFSKKDKNTNILEVKYEDIVKSPESTLETVCKFIGIEYQNSIVDSFNEKRESSIALPDHLAKTIHAKVSGKIDSNNTQKYLTKMSSLQIFLFELFASFFLEKYEYTLKYPFLSHPLLRGILKPVFYLARLINDFRYHKRDLKHFTAANVVD